MVDPCDEGPGAWCYDALVPQTWGYDGGGELTLLRSLELVWLRFDSGPAMFATVVEGEQAIEDFLIGAPAGPTPEATAAAVRGYLRGVRTPGGSTLLTLAAAPGAPIVGLTWKIDGVGPDWCELPGPAAAGVYGGASATTRRGIRALVRPGPVEVAVRALVTPAYVAVEARCTVVATAHQPHRIQVELAAGDAPGIALTVG